MKLIRGSEINDFLRCRKRWDYRWNQRLKPIRPNGLLFFGTLFHKFVEMYYEAFDHPLAFAKMQDMFMQTDTSRMEQVELDELWNTAVEVTNGYVEQWADADQRIQVLATEFTFAVPLDEEIAYCGTIDLLYQDEDGNLRFKDYKTTSSIDRYLQNAEMDRQISRYWWAIQQLARGEGFVWNGEWVKVTETDIYLQLKDREIAGFTYDIVLRDFPKAPEPLKKGGLSKAKNQKTTYAKYVEAIHKHNLLDDYASYVDMLDHLQAQETENGNAFFRRLTVTRMQAEVDAAIEEFYYTAHDAYAIQKFGVEKRAVYRNITHECPSCPVKALCMAELDGSNADMIRNLAYEEWQEDEYGLTLP